MSKVVLSVDPGFGGTGICMFVDGKLYKFNNIKCKHEGNERYVEVASKCAKHAMAWISDLLVASQGSKIKSFDIVIESPHAMGGVKGNASLGRGDVFKVAKLAGAIGVTAYLYVQTYLDDSAEMSSTSIRLHYPEVRTWKGQLSKETTQRRVLRDVKYAVEYIKDSKYKLKEEYPDHVFDAAGIGLWFIKETEYLNENIKEVK